MKKINELNECCSCKACANVCPKQAITFNKDFIGFEKPLIDSTLCVDCKLCSKVCPINHFDTSSKKTIMSCCLKLKDKNKIMESQSGGVFYVIAKQILLNSGIVYGVSNQDYAKTVRVDNINDLPILLKSKYAVTDNHEIFLNVEKDLKENRNVLFSGTPCHIYSLYQFLKIRNVNLSNLLTIDLICHGTMSRAVIESYVKEVEKKNKGKLIDLIYRDKRYGWNNLITTVKLDNQKEVHGNSFSVVFNSNALLNECCYNCNFTSPERISDMTIGDFWTLQKEGLSLGQFNSTGLSVCIIRSAKLKDIIMNSLANKEIEFKEIEEVSALQWNLRKPTPKPKNADKTKKCFAKHGFKRTVYFVLPFKSKIGRLIKRIKNPKNF